MQVGELRLERSAVSEHVLVAAGGCADPSDDFASAGTRAGACRLPLGRDDIRDLRTPPTPTWTPSTWRATWRRSGTALREANQLADLAYAAEGVDPPRDPHTLEPDPVGAESSSAAWWWWLGGGLAVAAIGAAAVATRDKERR